MSTLKKKKDNNIIVNKSFFNDETEDMIIDDTLLLVNSTVQLSVLQLIKPYNSLVEFASDTIILFLGNFVLNRIANHSKNINTTLRNAYYPLTSTLFFSTYSSLMYNNSYIRSFALITPITIAEYYVYKGIYK